MPDGDPVHLPALLVERLGVGSTSEARRLIAQGGVKLDGEAVNDLDVPRDRLEGATLQAGKAPFRALPRRLNTCYSPRAVHTDSVPKSLHSRQFGGLRAKPDSNSDSTRSLCTNESEAFLRVRKSSAGP